MNKEIKIVPPEGYEIDKDNSTFETIRFKPVKEYPTTIYELKEVKGWAVDKCTRDLDKLKVSTQTEDCIKIWPYKKYAKAVRHLCELQHLAIIWNDGHVNLGYPIAFAVTRNAFGEIVVDKTGIEKPLLFDTELKAIRFLKQFKDRLEIAAPLL